MKGFLWDRVCFYGEMASKQRLDLQLLTLGLATSRQQAQQLIRGQGQRHPWTNLG